MCLAIPGQIVEMIDAATHTAKVEVSGVRRAINLSLLADEGVQCGDWVLIHVGFALSRIDAGEAKRTLELLESLGEEFEQSMAEFATDAERAGEGA